MELKTRQDFCRLINERNYEVGVEIGVRTAMYSNLLLKNSNLKLLYSVDPWQPNIELSELPAHCDAIYEIAKGNLVEFGVRSQMIRDYSPGAANQFPDNYFDFVYIDGLHDFISVYADCCAWWPKLKSGGIFAGHDYCPIAWPGVVGAVNQFVAEENLELFLTGLGDTYGEGDGDRQSWWATKP